MICDDKSEIDVAIKAPLAFFRTEIINSVYEEIRRQTKFSHENVVKCLGFYHNKTQQYPVLILEWMFYGSLAKVFERSKLQKARYCYKFLFPSHVHRNRNRKRNSNFVFASGEQLD